MTISFKIVDKTEISDNDNNNVYNLIFFIIKSITDDFIDWMMDMEGWNELYVHCNAGQPIVFMVILGCFFQRWATIDDDSIWETQCKSPLRKNISF